MSQVAKDWSFSFSISPSNEYLGLISSRIDCSISLQYKGLPSIFSNTTAQKHQFFSTQLSSQSNCHPYLTTGKTIALTRWTFVGKVMLLLFNILSRLVMAFLPKSKHLLISWLQSPSAVILKPRKIKPVTFSIVSPSIRHEVMHPDAMIFAFECWVLSQLFHSSLSLSSRDSLVLLCFLPKGQCHLH